MRTLKKYFPALLPAFLGLAVLHPPIFAAEEDQVPRPSIKQGDLPGYTLAWSDEFEGGKLDTEKWNYRTDSKHLSTQKPENVVVSSGTLKLVLKKETAGGKEYTGGGVISKPLFKYGFYEARLKLPPGAGWHSSFWMQKYDGKGGTGPSQALQELDVIENDSMHPNFYAVNVHKWRDGHVAQGGKQIKTPNLSEAFHVYGCEFTAETVKYFFDGELVQTVDVTVAKTKDGKETPFPHGDQNIWLTSIASAMGGSGLVDETKLPATAEFDYVRFFERK